MNKFKYVVTAALLLNGFVSNAAVIYASETLDIASLETQEVKEVSKEVDPSGTASNQAEDLEETLDSSIVNSTEVADEEIEAPILEEVPANQQDTAKNREQETTMSSETSFEIASGEFGTSKWQIDSEGTLHIGEGKFADNWSYMSHWHEYNSSIKRIVFEGEVTAAVSSSHLFYDLYNVAMIVNLDFLDTSQVSYMESMFMDMENLTELDVSNFDTNRVVTMSQMFRGASNLTELDLSNFDTRNVKDMSLMFTYTSNLKKLDLSSFKTSNVVTMSGMFSHTNSLKELDLSKFDTSNVTNMHSMFGDAHGLTTLDLSGFDTRKAINMSNMFGGAKNLTTLDLSGFDTSQVTNMQHMFFLMESLTELNLSNFDTSQVAYMQEMFYGTNNLRSLRLGSDFAFISGNSAIGLVEPPVNEFYTGKWQNVGIGTTEKPEGEHIFGSSADFVTQYDGTKMADTFVWQTPNHESISAIDSTLFVGDTWNPEDNFVSATNRAGEDIPFDISMVSGTVDTSVVGEYFITFMNGQSKQTITVTVIPQPDYFVRADNFVIHKDDVNSTLDILDKSNASADNLADNTDVVAPIIISSSLKPEVGVYEVVLGVDKDETIQTTILVFVIDDNTGLSNNHVLFANNFEMPHSERHTLTHELVQALGKIEAYEIYNGRSVSDLVEVNTDDLAAIQTAPESGIYPVQLTLPTLAREQLQLTIYVTLIDDEEKEPEKEPEKENGPETDPGNNEVEKENGPGSGNGSSNGNGGTADRENVSNQIRPNNNRAAAARTLADRQTGRTAKPSDRNDSSRKLPKTGAVRTSSTLGILLVAASTSLYLWQKKKKN